MSSETLEIGTVLDGRYELLSVLGVGGFGAVYKARQLTTGQLVAIKVMTSGEVSDQRMGRFKREIRLIAKLKHPNIVSLVDSGQLSDERLFIALEFIDGRSLGQVLREQGRLPVAQAHRLLTQVAEALAFAHSKGVVHRDLKPDNIMVTEPGDLCNAHLLDLGIAGVVESERTGSYKPLTDTFSVPGTIAYMAPEQLLGFEAVSTSIDLFSWGIVLTECLCGEHPYGDIPAPKIIALQASKEPIPLHDVLAKSAYGPLLKKTLAKQVAARYADATEILADLRRIDPTDEAAQALEKALAKARRVALAPAFEDTVDSPRQVLTAINLAEPDADGFDTVVAPARPQDGAKTVQNVLEAVREEPALPRPAAVLARAASGPSPAVARAPEERAVRQTMQADGVRREKTFDPLTWTLVVIAGLLLVAVVAVWFATRGGTSESAPAPDSTPATAPPTKPDNPQIDASSGPATAPTTDTPPTPRETETPPVDGTSTSDPAGPSDGTAATNPTDTPPAAAEPAADVCIVSVATVPVPASIELAGHVVCAATPCEVSIPRGDKKVKLKANATGYLEAAKRIVPDAATIQVELRLQPASK